MICVIDNYDSFTYNLVQIFQKNNWPVKIYKNDQVTIEELIAQKNEIKAFLLSPGPGHPSQAGICQQVLKTFYKEKPIFGVCLGHQIIAEFFNARVINAPRIMHGKVSDIFHNAEGIYVHLSNSFQATRYHSLIVDSRHIPDDLSVTCWTQNSDGQKYEIMGLRHKELPIEGVQFHPESLLTSEGEKLLFSFYSVLYSF